MMKKNVLSILSSLITSLTLAQSIVVNPASSANSTLTAEELTIEVLIDGGECSTISNFQLKENLEDTFPSVNRSWGYFEKGNSNFPFEKGIVLTSGKAKDVEGPNSPNIASYGGYSWTGDMQATVLANYTTNNATVFEFDFVPYGNEISFRYIFASEEYPTFSCNGDYNDVFGFIISGPGITNDPGLAGKNIALLPNNDYVTINNVNDDYCGDDEYYVPGPFAYIEHGGRTEVLTAYSEVIPGETYHIRLLIADAGDTQYDSAVFLEAGSFNLGSTIVNLEGEELGEEYNVCGVDEYTLIVQVGAENVSYQWSFNGVEIPGATDQSYTATEPGYYSVEIISNSCSIIKGTNLNFANLPIVSDVESFACDPSGTHTFDLTQLQAEISQETNLNYSFYSTLEGAQTEDLNTIILNPTNYNVTNQATVYARVVNAIGCFDVVEISLNVGAGPETQAALYETCDSDDDGFAEFDLTTYNNQIVTSGTVGLNFQYFISEADALNGANPIPNPTNYTNITNPQMIYVKVYSLDANGDMSCQSIEELTLKVNEFPLFQNWNVNVCDSLGDQSEVVDLTDNQIIISTDINATLRYFPTLQDLENNTNQITNPTAYTVTASPTVIYVEISTQNGICREPATLTINFSAAPTVNDATLENCGLNGVSTFVLSEAIPQIVNNPNGLDITFHASYNNAVAGVNALPDEFTNTVPDQVIYARIQNATGCFSIAEVTLSTFMIYETLTTGITVCDDPDQVYDGSTSIDLTQMEQAVGNALGGGNYTYQYYTSFANAQNGIGPIADPSAYINTSPNQTIYVRASSGNQGCPGIVEFNVHVLEVPNLSVESNITFCEMVGSVDYELSGEYQTITWFDPDGNVVSNDAFVTFDQEGIYTVEVTQNGFACPAMREVEVTFDNLPTISGISVNGSTVTVNVSGSTPPYEYSYNNGLTWHNTHVMTNVPSGVHYMLVRSKYGCISEKVIFGVLGIPNVITPNGDGYNDSFTIRGLELYPDSQIKIFDRYGKIFVDRKVGTNFIWDGKYMGRNLPSGDYWYIIEIDQENRITGHVTIKNQ